MLTPDPTGAAVRARRRRNEFGDDPACVLCGVSDPHVLILDVHHVANRVNDDLAAVVCRNCHARQTERLRDIGMAGRYAGGGPTPIDRLIAVLAGAGSFLTDLGTALTVWARWLTLLVSRLDALTDWRRVLSSMPEPSVMIAGAR